MNLSHLNSLSKNSPNWLRPLWTKVALASEHGFVVAESGAFAVCPRTKVMLGESSWLHVVIPGVSEILLRSIEVDLGFRNNDPSIDVLALGLPHVTGGYDFDHYVPKEIKELLLVTNGLSLFGGHLRIWGVQTQSAILRNSYYGDVKMIDGEMTSYNIWSRPKYLKPKILVFGVYPSNGSILHMKEGEAAVYNTDRYGQILFKSWPSIGEWLQSEIERLALFFDEVGNFKTSYVETHPQ